MKTSYFRINYYCKVKKEKKRKQHNWCREAPLLLKPQLVSSLLVGKEVCWHGWDSRGAVVQGEVTHTLRRR